MNGIPGSGKTVLAASIIEELLAQSTKIFYFFCDDNYTETRFTAKILGCLLYQMINFDHQLLKCVSPLYDKTTQKRLTSVEVAKKLFEDVAKRITPCYLVIDALDECCDKYELIRLMLEFTKTCAEGMKILLTSRDYLDIKRALEKKPTKHLLTSLSIEDDNAGDIETFVTHLVADSDDLATKLEESPGLYQYVVQQLTSAAGGMFLLPENMVKDLEKECEVHDIYNCLKALPTSLDDYYMLILGKMDTGRQKLARKVFTWVTGSKRPLSVAEMNTAFSLDGSRYLQLESEIKRACGCFVRIEGGQVRFSHNTVKQFLLESRILQSSPLRKCFVDDDRLESIADTCCKYIFDQEFRKPLSPGARFSAFHGDLDKDSIRKLYPFLEYAALYWVDHCRLSRSPGRFIHRIRIFLGSSQFSFWYEAVSTFSIHESFAIVFDQLRGWFQSLNIVSLRSISPFAQDMVFIERKLSHLWEFIDTWDQGLRACPPEIYDLEPFIDVPDWRGGTRAQQMMLTEDTFKRDNQRMYNLIDGQRVGFRCDRFLIAAQTVFSWHSLMRSGVWPKSRKQIDPLIPQTAWFQTQHLQSRCIESRYGLARAAADKVTVTAILSKELDAMAIVWPVFDDNRDAPPIIKSYAWFIRPNSISVILQRIEWTDIEDPCRVDRTRSRAFNGSRAAIAFTPDGKTLWTPGGAYNLHTGHQAPPPNIFCDPSVHALTFSRNATVVGGIRGKSQLEIYQIHDDTLLAQIDAGTDALILGMSPLGGHCLFLKGALSDSHDITEQVCLFSVKEGRAQFLWQQEANVSTETPPDSEDRSMKNFYNNGGLFAFSENESILVLYVPSRPDWKLVAFDLANANIASTIWSIDCSSILMDSPLLCISFCPFRERQLYMLDDSGYIRAGQISRKDTVVSHPIFTTESDRVGAICSGTLINGDGIHLVVASLKWYVVVFEYILLFYTAILSNTDSL